MLPISVALADVSHLTAEAFDARSGELVYREHHRLNDAEQKHWVDYRNAAGEQLAYKSLDYSPSRFAPSFHMQFEHRPLEYGARWESGALALFNSHREGQSKWLTAETDTPLVVDGGLNFFILEHLPQLLDNETIKLSFAMSLRLSTIDLQLQRVGADVLPLALADYRLEPQSVAVIRARVNNWLLRQLAPDIYFVYDRESQSLQLFYGPTNLVDDEGAAEQVVIRFPSPEAGAAAVLADKR